MCIYDVALLYIVFSWYCYRTPMITKVVQMCFLKNSILYFWYTKASVLHHTLLPWLAMQCDVETEVSMVSWYVC